jgi:large subunit ribosomal protein L21
MFAVVEIKGHQYKIEKGVKFNVEKMEEAEGEMVTLKKVLMVGEGGDVKIGEPYVIGSKVTAKVLKQFKGDKVRVFKKKAKKRFMINKGHRQNLTRIEITEIKG